MHKLVFEDFLARPCLYAITRQTDTKLEQRVFLIQQYWRLFAMFTG